jgi:hypothetical protein
MLWGMSAVVDLKLRRKRSPGPKEHALLSGMDWRTREGKFLVAARRDLTKHVGRIVDATHFRESAAVRDS